MRVRVPTGSFKFLLTWLGVLLFRLLPFRPPNVEPMLAAVMPFSKRYGILGSFAFGFFGIVLYDAVTAGWGVWTWIPAVCYGLLGIASHYYFKNRPASRGNFVAFGMVGTVLYDAATGLTIGPIFNHQPFMIALTGQIPFTVLHLLGTILFALVLSPALYRWVVENEALELETRYTLA